MVAGADRVCQSVEQVTVPIGWVRGNDVGSWKLVLSNVVKCSRVIAVITNQCTRQGWLCCMYFLPIVVVFFLTCSQPFSSVQ